MLNYVKKETMACACIFSLSASSGINGQANNTQVSSFMPDIFDDRQPIINTLTTSSINKQGK
jgi:hypothetical protein